MAVGGQHQGVAVGRPFSDARRARRSRGGSRRSPAASSASRASRRSRAPGCRSCCRPRTARRCGPSGSDKALRRRSRCGEGRHGDGTVAGGRKSGCEKAATVHGVYSLCVNSRDVSRWPARSGMASRIGGGPVACCSSAPAPRSGRCGRNPRAAEPPPRSPFEIVTSPSSTTYIFSIGEASSVVPPPGAMRRDARARGCRRARPRGPAGGPSPCRGGRGPHRAGLPRSGRRSWRRPSRARPEHEAVAGRAQHRRVGLGGVLQPVDAPARIGNGFRSAVAKPGASSRSTSAPSRPTRGQRVDARHRCAGRGRRRRCRTRRSGRRRR